MPSSRSVRKTRIAISPRLATSTLLKTAMAPVFSPSVSLPDGLTVARAASVPFVILLYAWNFHGHDYWATALFAAAMATDWFDGRIARQPRPLLAARLAARPGSGQDPRARRAVMLVDQRVGAGLDGRAIVVREFLVTGLRLAALERGVVLHARDLGKLKTWSQAVAAGVGGFAAAGAWRNDIAWWALLVARRADVDLRARLRPGRAAPLARRCAGLIVLGFRP